jgi:hypothetical protein
MGLRYYVEVLKILHNNIINKYFRLDYKAFRRYNMVIRHIVELAMNSEPIFLFRINQNR